MGLLIIVDSIMDQFGHHNFIVAGYTFKCIFMCIPVNKIEVAVRQTLFLFQVGYETPLVESYWHCRVHFSVNGRAIMEQT